MSAAIAVALAWRSFICRACGLIYDEAKGDPDSGLAPGTRFEDIPEDWSCPLCGVGKADFEPHEVQPVVRRAVASPARLASVRKDPGIVIVGAGRAGWEMAQALREIDPMVPVTLVSACAGDAYDKPTLSVACARGIAPADLVKENGTDMALRMNVRLLANTHAVRIDLAARRLRTTRGSLPYRELVLAHGAAPREAALLTPDLCWRINDLRAYQRLRAALGTRRRHVLVVGAGLVGCELANDLALEGHGVTLLDTQSRPLAAHLPALASERLMQAWRDLPLRFVGGATVATIQRLEGMVCVTTACGQSFEADQVVAATGLQAANRLAADAGLSVDEGGITVGAQDLSTSDARVHALGDCASVAGRAQRFIEPIARQARAIASAILGDGSQRFQSMAVPLRVKTTSMPVSLHGVPDRDLAWTVESDSDAALHMSQRQGDRLVARLEATPATAHVRPPLAA